MRSLRELLEPLRRRIMLSIARGVVQHVDDVHGLQGLQVRLLEGEVRGGIPRVQEYGFSSHPRAGTQAAVVFVGGNRAQGIAVGVDDPAARPKGLEPGEVAIYDDQGLLLKLQRDGTVLVKGTKLRVEGMLEVAGNIEATGHITDKSTTSGLSMQEMRDVFNAHGHIPLAGSPPTPQMGGGGGR